MAGSPAITDRLVGHGVVLRPWHADDRDAILTAFAGEDMAEQARTPVDGPAAAAAWLEHAERSRADRTRFYWAVTDDAGAVLGNVALSDVEPRHGTGWVSYWTTAAARGRGVATAGLLVLSDWAFTDLDLFRLELGHRLANVGSCRVAARAGYLPEGIQRSRLRYGDRRYDVEPHARLATDPVPTSSR